MKSHIHSSSFVSNSKQTKHLSLDLFYDTNMLTKNEQGEEVEMDPKAQVVFCTHYCLHYLQIHVIGEKHNIGMLGHIEAYYG